MRRSNLESPGRAARVGFALDLGIVLLIPVVTALAALVLEDLMPAARCPEPDGPRCGPDAVLSRWLVGLVFLGTLVTLVIFRQRRLRFRGTLYYIRYLAEWMADAHLTAYRTRHAVRDVRVVSRWMTQTPRADDSVDLTDDVEAMARDLADAMNSDDHSTGYNLAPNLIVSAAVALGYELYCWPETWMSESRKASDEALPLRPWRLDDLYPLPDVEHPDESWRSGALPALVPARPEASSLATHLTITLTGSTAVTPWGSGKRRTYQIGVPVDGGGWRGVVVAQPRRATTRWGRAPAHVDTASDAVVHPIAAVRASVEAIRLLLHTSPDAPLVTAMRVPKTVAFAIGYGLANGSRRCAGEGLAVGCTQESCLHPWSRLIVLWYDEARPRGHSPVISRVHASQPCLQILVDRVRTGVIDAETEERHRAHCDCAA